MLGLWTDQQAPKHRDKEQWLDHWFTTMVVKIMIVSINSQDIRLWTWLTLVWASSGLQDRCKGKWVTVARSKPVILSQGSITRLPLASKLLT